MRQISLSVSHDSVTNAISVAKVTSVTNATSDKIVISVTNRTIVANMKHVTHDKCDKQ